MTRTTDNSTRYDSMRAGARNNAFRPIVMDLPDCRLMCEWVPPCVGITGRIDWRAVRDSSAPELMYRWTVTRGGEEFPVMYPEDVIALLDGESLDAVRARRREMAGDPFGRVARNVAGGGR